MTGNEGGIGTIREYPMDEGLRYEDNEQDRDDTSGIAADRGDRFEMPPND
jgi:hypothetical protein